jgi:hypothetical protein
VTLTANPAAGSVFGGWSGACAGQSTTCTVSVTAPTNVTATFTPLYTLTVGTSGSGTVASNPTGIACPGDCAETYVSGTTVVLTATPATGSAFSSWTGACAGSSAVCTLSITSVMSTVANFGPAVTLTVTVSGTGTGLVASSPAGITCPSDCSEPYAKGQVVTLTATPTNGSMFLGWSGACSGSATTCTVTMSAGKAVTAKFRR